MVVEPAAQDRACGVNGAGRATVRIARGGLAMLLGELITLRQQRLPVKVVVFNNGALSFVELEMKAAGVVTYGTDLDNPDFAGMARSAGLFGVRVNKADELDGALKEAFGHDGPTLVDVRTARHELALPPKLTCGEIKGFTRYSTRTILSGGGEELVELVGTASLIGGFTTDPAQLIAARSVMGLGAAMTFPATLSLIFNVFTERTAARSAWR